MRTKVLHSLILLALAGLAACSEEKDVMADPSDDGAVKEVVRPAALAGRGWYPGTPESLAKTVDGYLAEGSWEGDRPLALIVPHAGYDWSGPMQGKVYATIRGKSYRRVFLLGVPHRERLRGISIPRVTHYRTPLGKVPLDREAADRLLARGAPFTSHPRAHDQEHSVEIHLPFLQRALKDFEIVPMLVYVHGNMVHTAAAALKEELRPGDLVIASSDNTHYGARFGYVPFPADDSAAENLRKLDMDAVAKILDLDLPGYVAYKDETGITTCGFSPICVLMALLPGGVKGTMTGYDTSASRSGDWSSAVSYVGIAFTGADWEKPSVPAGAEALTEEEQAFLLRLARESMERYVKEGIRLDPEGEGWEVPEKLRRKRGTFVTLRIGKKLRGCIGDIFPSRPLFKAIAARAISSAVEDSRFRPVREEELAKIHIEISVLSVPEDVDSYEEIELGKHGILLSYNGRMRSVYLPQVATEMAWDLPETLSSLSRKAGLPRDAWRSPNASFQVFTAQVFGEDD
jgi:AmmeMemoRadiSam system protein B/AmmeMemoRadiSam system protein A